MIDNLSLGITHGLMLLVAWRIMRRPELDTENAAPRRFGKSRGSRDA